MLEYDTILVIPRSNLEDMNFNILYTAGKRTGNNLILLPNSKKNKNIIKIFEESPKFITLLQKLILYKGKWIVSFKELL